MLCGMCDVYVHVVLCVVLVVCVSACVHMVVWCVYVHVVLCVVLVVCVWLCVWHGLVRGTPPPPRAEVQHASVCTFKNAFVCTGKTPFFLAYSLTHSLPNYGHYRFILIRKIKTAPRISVIISARLECICGAYSEVFCLQFHGERFQHFFFLHFSCPFQPQPDNIFSFSFLFKGIHECFSFQTEFSPFLRHLSMTQPPLTGFHRTPQICVLPRLYHT